MSDIDTRLMKAGVALAEELSFSRAAVKLNIGQSALTKQIKELEKWLGYALFLRGSSGVSTTPEGDIFVEEARLALMHQERAVTLSRALNQRKELVLHIGKSPYTDPYLLTISCLYGFLCTPTSRLSCPVNWPSIYPMISSMERSTWLC